MNTQKLDFDPVAWATMTEQPTCCTEPVQSTVARTEPLRIKPSLTEQPQADLPTEMRIVAGRIVDQGSDITSGYQRWLALGFALADGMGEDGRDVFHALSRLNDGYSSSECDRQYSACLRGRGSGITYRTFFQMAKEAGIDIGHLATNETVNTPQFAPLAPLAPLAPNASVDEGREKEKCIKVIDKQQVIDSMDMSLPLNTPAFGAMAQVAQVARVAQTGAKSTDGYTFSDKLKAEDLDGITHAVFDHHADNPAKCDAMLLGCLNVVSGLMGAANGTADCRSGIYGIYDGRRVYAPLFNIIYSGAGSEKGSLVFARMLAHGLQSEMRQQYETEKQAYDRAKVEWESKSKRERGEAPEEPVYRDPFVPGNSSSSAVYRAMDANGGWGLMFETEADTVSDMIQSDYGNYSDLMRKAHHHEMLSMNRVTEKIHIDIDEPRLSILLTCTPGQLPALFPSFENGLGSRFLFYALPDEEVLFHDVFALSSTPLEDTYRRLGDYLLPLVHDLKRRAGHPIQFVMSHAQQQEFIRTYSEMLTDQFGMLGKGIRAFVFRIALECFRYSMILTTMRRLSQWHADGGVDTHRPIFRDEENALTCDDRDFRTAMTIIGCLIHHTARVYAVMAKDDDNPFARSNVKLSATEQQFFQALPEGEFRAAKAYSIAEGMGIPPRTAQRMVSRLCNLCRLLVPVRRGVYRRNASERS